MLVRTEYLMHPINSDPNYSAEKDPLIKVMSILMMVTGVNRLFTREDFHLFFKRLILLGKEYKIIERFLLDDELLVYYLKGNPFSLGIGDPLKTIGLIFGNGYVKYAPEEKWLNNIPEALKKANFAGVLLETVVFPKHLICEEDEDGTNFIFSKSNINITLDDMKNAQFIASRIVKEFPENVFEKWSNLYPNAVRDFDDELDRLSRIVQFDYGNLSIETKEAIREHFEQFFTPEKWNEELIIKLTHLAWAYANNYIYAGPNDAHFVEEFISFDEAGLEFEDEGINLEETFDVYSLNDLWDLLKIK